MVREDHNTIIRRELEEFISLVADSLVEIMHEYIEWARNHDMVECIRYVQYVHIDNLNGLLACLYDMRAAHSAEGTEFAGWIQDMTAATVQRCVACLQRAVVICRPSTIQFMEFILRGIAHSCENGGDYHGIINREGSELLAVLSHN